MKLIYVEWIDAETEGDSKWQEMDKVMKWAAEPLPVASTCGFLIYECDTHLVVVDTLMGTDCSCATKIPKAWLVKREVLKETG